MMSFTSNIADPMKGNYILNKESQEIGGLENENTDSSIQLPNLFFMFLNGVEQCQISSDL